MNHEYKIAPSTLARTAALALALTNQVLSATGHSVLPIQSAELEQLISTGLTTIPTELYESASIDGAGKLSTFFKITLPLLRPTIESVLILGFIYTFKVFDLVFVMTGGGPVNSTQMLSTYSYKLSFGMYKYSMGSAVANVLFVLLMLVGLLYLRATREENAA